MKNILGICILIFLANFAFAQPSAVQFKGNTLPNRNIYTIKKQFLADVLHNPTAQNTSPDDNELERFDRWFRLLEPRCYPTGNIPSPDVLIRNMPARDGNMRTTSGVTANWHSVGPFNVPEGFFGIGRVNVVVVDPQDTNTLYAGTACGGVWISHDYGDTWATSSDNFPSLSIADIAVNPQHTDTLYAATGDGYGYGVPCSVNDSIFWGGLYSAGIMKSTDGGHSWNTTGLSYSQSDRFITHKILVHPTNPNILIAGTSQGVFKSTDAGVTWTQTSTNYIFDMRFKPLSPNTIYAVDPYDVLVSVDAGSTWTVSYSGIASGGRSALDISPQAPNDVWVFNDMNTVYVSHDAGNSFTPAGSSPVFSYGYYGNVFGVSPTDTNELFTAGMDMGKSLNSGSTWTSIGDSVHPDNHGFTYNWANANTFYTGDDGGIWRTCDNGVTWANISRNMAISQIYRMTSSRQNPAIMMGGLQDNSTFYNNGVGWSDIPAIRADGMDCAISPVNDSIQIASYQYGNFLISYDHGNSFNPISIGSGGYWTSPVAFVPGTSDSIIFALEDIYASYDRGITFTNLTGSMPFPMGAVALAIAPSNHNVMYSADFNHVMATTDGGITWSNVTGTGFTDSTAITGLAVDYHNPQLVYLTVSGYQAGEKVFVSTTGGFVWNNITANLANLPADCIAVDSSVPGAIYIGTDNGVYYTDSSTSSWVRFGSGLPNVIVDDININYTVHKINVATYGRGIWQAPLNSVPLNVGKNSSRDAEIAISPNPATDKWTITFPVKPTAYHVRLTDITGNVIKEGDNIKSIDAKSLAKGVYFINVTVGAETYSLKAIRD